jgi:pyruvate formate lyase activating enzyme
VEEDALFYSRSLGGMTLSGGEPLAQREFALALLREAKRRHIGRSMETCGHVPWETLREACLLLDSVMFDIKTLDSARHEAYTGVKPDRVLDNFGRMTETFPDLPVVARTPVIPGFNDSLEALLPIAETVGAHPGAQYELLPYHRLGTQKYLFLQREALMGDAQLPASVFARLQRAVAEVLAKTGKRLVGYAA